MDIFKNLNYFPNNNFTGINFYIYDSNMTIQSKKLIIKLIAENEGVS